MAYLVPRRVSVLRGTKLIFMQASLSFHQFWELAVLCRCASSTSSSFVQILTPHRCFPRPETTSAATMPPGDTATGWSLPIMPCTCRPSRFRCLESPLFERLEQQTLASHPKSRLELRCRICDRVGVFSLAHISHSQHCISSSLGIVAVNSVGTHYAPSGTVPPSWGADRNVPPWVGEPPASSSFRLSTFVQNYRYCQDRLSSIRKK